MREIEFRAKHKFNGKWVYGSYFHELDMRFGVTTSNDYIIGFDEYADVQNNIEIDIDTLGQYTGLKDKNGKKIYEGDIIKSNHNIYFYKVYYDENRFIIEDKWGNLIRPTQKAINHFDCEIVGNRWDNPELLEGRDDV